MIDRIFLKHPRSVDEGYWEHFRVAGSFGVAMIGGGLKACVHAILPNAYETAGSETIKRLHTIMVQKRGAKRDATMQMLECEWII